MYCLFHGLGNHATGLINFKELEKKGYIKITPEGVSLREPAIKLFEVPDKEKMWAEFFCTFPMKVPGRNGGSRPLRAEGLDTQFAKKVKAKYFSFIEKRPEMHRTIMDSLEAEMEMRRTSSSFQYMHAMEAWLNAREWEKYSYLVKEKKEKVDESTTGYGQKLT